MNRWTIGHALLTVGLGWVATYRILGQLFPVSMPFVSGSSIGGGFTVLLAYAATAVGAAFVVTELFATRPKIRRGRQLAPAEPLRLSRPSVWIPGLVSVTAALACLVAFIAPLGPGQGRIGAIGLSVDADGAPILVLVVCRRSIDSVVLTGPYSSTAAQVRYATLTPPDGDLTETTSLTVDTLPTGWSGGPVTLPLDEPDSRVIVTAEGDESYLQLLSFTAADLSELTPSRILFDIQGFVSAVDAQDQICR